jgi:hypothetical protein
LPDRQLVCDLGGSQLEWKSERTAKVVVVQGNGSPRYVRRYLKGKLGQTQRTEGVMKRKLKMRMGLKIVEAYFLKNWSL